MTDMLVNLLKLPEYGEIVEQLKSEEINIRRVQPFEMSLLKRFVEKQFALSWADEVTPAFAQKPITCFIATHEKKIIGFAAYECTRHDYFGPTGVSKEYRGKGIGKALLLACLHSMREMGYVYAIIGGVGPVDFYANCVGATPIPDTNPGIFVDILDKNAQ